MNLEKLKEMLGVEQTQDKPLLLIILGRSCSGKTTLLRKLRDEDGIYEAVSYTTRSIREGEVNGKDYWFVSKEEMSKLNQLGKLIEYVIYDDNYYGLGIDSFDYSRDNAVIVEPGGARMLKGALSDKFNIKMIQLDAPDEVIIERSRKRGDNPELFGQRFKEDKKIFQNTEADVILNSNEWEI
ncbi:MAG: AAA family ATPase [Bacilli bacterium]|nr:AAA family ATPase [Bacilli bacterium]